MRMCTELIQLGPVLGLVFADNALVDPDTWFDEEDDPLGVVVGRGYTDGSLATDLPPDWIGTFVWTSLFAAHLVVSRPAASCQVEVPELTTRWAANREVHTKVPIQSGGRSVASEPSE